MYLISTLYFLPIWLFLLFKKSNIKEQIFWSLLGGALGPLVQWMHLQDWWNPNFFCTDCLIHIEDILFGVFVGGISGVIYNDFFVKQHTVPIYSKSRSILSVSLGIVAMLLSFVPFALLGISSFFTTSVASVSVFLVIAIIRKDLIGSMFMSGIIMMILAIPFYVIGLVLDPTWIEKEWLIERLSGIFIWKIPVEEFFWFFLVGLSFSAFWESWWGIRYLKEPNGAS